MCKIKHKINSFFYIIFRKKSLFCRDNKCFKYDHKTRGETMKIFGFYHLPYIIFFRE